MGLVVYRPQQDSDPLGIFHLPFEDAGKSGEGTRKNLHLVTRIQLLIQFDETIFRNPGFDSGDNRIVHAHRFAVKTDNDVNPSREANLMMQLSQIETSKDITR